MSDINYAHRFLPSRKGRCKQIVGGKKRGYSICGLLEDAPPHQKQKQIDEAQAIEQYIGEQQAEQEARAIDQYTEERQAKQEADYESDS